MEDATKAKLRNASLGQLGELFITYRDRRAAIRQREKDLTSIMEDLSTIIREKMIADEQDGFRAKGHTFYTYDLTSATVFDPEAFINYIMESGDFDVIERRASKDACEQYAAMNATEENPTGDPPPGVNLVKIEKLGCRKV